ncbi:toxin-antitoxin (TA) system antitoxin [Marinobacter sp. EVN1]|uniref:type II toxin-antitoxin system Phd/YefM family antitoxin n=1 Tax=Marinobacter sp. EVN1 TaxID=1397532 RepID=UPI0003B9088B|nr:toxin-antitoxin (TA) system antitoxin [Marinobacter sp. EVN1]ERS84098.1 toxin-antitoxin (TA) system antitoxin [Marinobacter sp. EVN1]
MTHQIYSEITASISELKKNPMAAVDSGEGFPIAVLNRNKPAFYCVPAEIYEAMLDRLDDQELVAIVKERRSEPSIRVDLNEL